MLLTNQQNDIYNFLNYIINDKTGCIGTQYMDYQGPVSKLLVLEPRAVFMYNLFVDIFNKNKKYCKKEGFNVYKFLNFPSITENIASMRLQNNTDGSRIFQFCICLWLYLHH